MVVIRLARHGSKHRPFYHLTVADRRARRDGTFVERVGFYNPIAKGHAERLRVDLGRVDYWIGQGAQTTTTVNRLLKEARREAQIKAAQPAKEPVADEEKTVPASEGVQPAESADTAAAPVEESSSTLAEKSSAGEDASEPSEQPQANAASGATTATDEAKDTSS